MASLPPCRYRSAIVTSRQTASPESQTLIRIFPRATMPRGRISSGAARGIEPEDRAILEFQGRLELGVDLCSVSGDQRQASPRRGLLANHADRPVSLPTGQRHRHQRRGRDGLHRSARSFRIRPSH